MGTFNRLLSATFHPPRKWVLVKDLSYQCDQLTSEETEALKTVGVIITPEGTVTVPIDFETDIKPLGSIDGKSNHICLMRKILVKLKLLRLLQIKSFCML
jgi:hypothetical protein